MDVLLKHLKVAFELALPERVTQTIRSDSKLICNTPTIHLRSKMMSRDCYYNLSRKLSSDYSVEEIDNSYLDMVRRCSKDKRIPSNLFQLLVEFDKKVLANDNGQPVCKREQMMKWREISLELGQDIFTTSYFAYLNAVDGRQQFTFDWPSQIFTDDLRLKHLLDEGIAENHFHLGGSTQLFALSWVALMNHPDRIYGFLHPANGEKGPLDVNRKGNISFDIEDRPMPWEERIRYAAWLRAKLFCLANDEYDSEKSIISEFLSFDSSFVHITELERIVLSLRLRHGEVFEQPNQWTACLDYAIRKDNRFFNRHSYNRLLAGERELMYQCFSKCFNGTFSDSEQNLFYMYLLLKNQLRSELIQVNNEVGFANFAIYQDRKESFWSGIEEYSIEAKRLAVNASMESGSIKSMELRITPGKSTNNLMHGISWIDSAIQFSEDESLPLFNCAPQIDSLNSEGEKMRVGISLPFFYTFHFIKSKDIIPKNDVPINSLMPRNHKARSAAKKSAIALSVALEQSNYICSRVRGIDAASFEIGCRPETFATEFRYLRNFVPDSGSGTTRYFSRSFSPKLSATYHVGEDFLDIADGLRAMDEAIHFLQYKRGDRVGHALVLGVEPKDFYRMKSYRVILSKQDMLDNLVWLLMRSLEFGIEIPSNTREILTSRCLRLLREIYGNCCKVNEWNVSLHDYYNAWKLRGDHPDCYIKTEYTKPIDKSESLIPYGASISHYKHFYTYNHDLNIYRNDPRIAGLMHYYHFGYSERKKGAEVEVLDIDDNYIVLMREMQKKIQHLLSEKGIAIECNLTSNQLIGTFKRYDKHPIFKFNTSVINPSATKDQLSVSLNTDDQGVFDTSLENEYAILVECMAEMKENGERMYSDDEIYDYVDHLRKLGLSQTFPLPASLN